jgi:hypothetical protein
MSQSGSQSSVSHHLERELQILEKMAHTSLCLSVERSSSIHQNQDFLNDDDDDILVHRMFVRAAYCTIDGSIYADVICNNAPP